MLMDMQCKEAGELDGAPIRVPADVSYGTCSVCRRDCEPDASFGFDEPGAHIAFICPEHRIN